MEKKMEAIAYDYTFIQIKIIFAIRCMHIAVPTV
jgi:hypothetical protein